MTELERLRVDRWLWCARFYKTRALASKEVNGGKVHVNGQRVKSSCMLKVGDQLKITKGIYELIIDVLRLLEKRGSAKVAVLMYCETDESIATRDRINELNKISRQHLEAPKRKPDKRQRRELLKVRNKD